MPNPNFALQWLEFLGNEVYNNGQRIFEYTGQPKYEISRLQTRIVIGQKLGKTSEAYTLMSFQELQNLPLIIVMKDDMAWRDRQKYYFKFQRKTRDAIGITESTFNSQKLQIIHDVYNRRIWLAGRNVLSYDPDYPNSGKGPWVVYDEDNPIGNYAPKDFQLTKEESRALLRQQAYGKNIEDNKSIVISSDEIPVLISDEQYLVCILKQKTCQRMIVVGESGKGKSLFVNGVGGRIFYTWQDRMGWLIDPLDQFNDLSLPQDYNKFNEINELIGNEPKPMPAVQLYLASKNKTHMKHKDISLMVTLNFLEFLRKYKFYVHGIKDMDVGDTYRYLHDYIDHIKEIKTANEMRDIMFEKIPNAHKDKGMQAMIYKWVNTFETIFKEKFLTNVYGGNTSISEQLKIKLNDGRVMEGHPFIMCYEAGLIPVFNIAMARRERWLRNYLADLMQKIVEHQIHEKQKAEIEGRKTPRVWIIADELNEIYEHGKKKDNAYNSFAELYRQGRINNLGFIGNTQSLTKLSDDMFDNATHICCVYIKNAKERRRIGETYNVDKGIYSKIGNLKEQEMMIFSKEPFVIYDRWGRRRVIDDRTWFKGKIIPPINYHHVPK